MTTTPKRDREIRDKGFLDGLSYCVELTGEWAHEGAAELILNESSMRKEIIKNIKKISPEIYKSLKSKNVI